MRLRVLAFLLLAALIAGCADRSTETPSTTPPSGATTASPSPQPSPQPAPSPSQEAPLRERLAHAAPSCCATIPFPHTFDAADHKLYALAGAPDRYPVVFGSWGGHAAGHTGHVEGDNKANYRVLLRPSGAAVEMTGVDGEFRPVSDGDGVCEADERCGVTNATAIASDIWYETSEPMWLAMIVHDTPNPNAGYAPGEAKMRLELWRNGSALRLQHLGALSPELEARIREAGRADLLDHAPFDVEVQIDPMISIPAGTRLARPQVVPGMGQVVNGSWVAPAEAQTEWSWRSLAGEYDHAIPTPCEYDLFAPEDRAALQRAMDAAFAAPDAWSPFHGTPLPETIAEAALCASRTQDLTNDSALSTENGFGWFDYAEGAHAHGGVVSIYPIHKETATYAAHVGDFQSPASSFMLIRGFQEPIHQDGSWTVTTNGSTTRLRLMSAEVLDLQPANDTRASTTLVAKVLRTRVLGAPDITGQYLGVRYSLRPGQLVVRWGDLAPTRDAVVMPPPIPSDDVACDEQPYFCYTHDSSASVPK